MVGIVSYGAYVPRLRLQRGVVVQAHQWCAPGLKGLAKGERAMANWDEDVVTMAVEAARDAVPEAQRSSVRSVLLASTSAPFADRQNAGIVKEALNLLDAVGSVDISGSQKAGTGALLQALHAAAASAGPTLCIGAEQLRARPASEAELINGDGAAALLVAADDGIARFLGSHSVSIDFVDHFRGRDADFDYAWESRWVRDQGYVGICAKTIQDTLAKLGMRPEEIAQLVIPIPVAGVADAIARAAKLPPTCIAPTLNGTIGYAGAAQPLLMLTRVLEDSNPGDRILVVGFGQGCDVLAFEATQRCLDSAKPRGVSGWTARRKPESNYLKFLAFAGLLDLERGMRAELDQKQALTALYRNRRTVLGLVGGRDRKTGQVQFPPTPISVGSEHALAADFEDYPLAERPARILTYTADNLTYTPDPPNCYGMIEFDGGGRMLAEFTDIDSAAIEVGLLLRMSFRIKAVDDRRSFIKYFWKATPAF